MEPSIQLSYLENNKLGAVTSRLVAHFIKFYKATQIKTVDIFLWKST